MHNHLKKVSNNIAIEEGVQAIQNTLVDIYFSEGISTKALAKSNLLPLPLVAAIKGEFIKSGFLVQDKGIRLTMEGRNFVEDELGYRGLNKSLYLKLIKEPWGLHHELEDVKVALNNIFKLRPGADVTLDQSKCTMDTALRRAILCLKYSSLIGKRILCVGDDDFVSIALGFLLKKLYPDMKYCKTMIYVMDIDERILKCINNISEEEHLPIRCIRADLRYPVEDKIEEKFDCFFTDPPYTMPGLKLFLSRGLEALKREKSIPIFLSYAHRSPDFDLSMQQYFGDLGLTISEILAGFNNYDGAEIIGSKGQMIVLKTTSRSKAVIEDSYEEPIYTGEIKRTVRYYKCSCCGKVIKVGSSEKVKTIEELKAKGCADCSNKIFQLIQKQSLSDRGGESIV